MTQLFSNNAKATLSAGIDLVATSISLQAGEGALFSSPTAPDFELITISDDTNVEIVKLTSRATDVLTIERGQESIAASAFSTGASVEGRLTAGTLSKHETIADNKLTVDNDGDARGADSVNVQPSRLTTDQVASGLNSIAMGKSSKASGADSIAMGESSKASGADSVVIGQGGDASGDFGISVGTISKATGTRSLAIGLAAGANPAESISIGPWTRVFVIPNSMDIRGLPALHKHFDNANGDEYKYNNTGLVGTLMSDPIDLTGGSTWAASTTYGHGEAVTPTTPNGYQYIRYDYTFDIYNDPTLSTYVPGASDASEPVWPTVGGIFIEDGYGDWYPINNSLYTLNLADDFLVEEILFIAHKCSGITVQANISIGTTGDLTKLVNNQPTVGLTTDKTVTKWTLAHPIIVPDITIKIDTLATGTQMLGNFVFKGYYSRWGNS